MLKISAIFFVLGLTLTLIVLFAHKEAASGQVSVGITSIALALIASCCFGCAAFLFRSLHDKKHVINLIQEKKD